MPAGPVPVLVIVPRLKSGFGGGGSTKAWRKTPALGRVGPEGRVSFGKYWCSRHIDYEHYIKRNIF